MLAGLVAWATLEHPVTIDAPVATGIDWPEAAELPAAERELLEVTWSFRDENGWAYSNVALSIIDIARRAWYDELRRVPTITGTSAGEEYRWEFDHLAGCAVDFRTWAMSFRQAWDVSQRLAAYLQWELDPQSRVVLWWDSKVHAAHIHAAVQNCGQPLTKEEIANGREARSLWGWNGR